MKLLLIDNYDSFTYNLREVLLQHDAEIIVVRNDEVNMSELEIYDGIIFSPGPGIPDYAGRLKEVILKTYQKKPLLGICLGMQAIGEVFGCQLRLMDNPLHGKATEIAHYDNPLFDKIPNRFTVGRYHSWVIDEKTVNDKVEVISSDDNGMIMGIKASKYPVYGLQFHPESIMTIEGHQLITNFLNLINIK